MKTRDHLFAGLALAGAFLAVAAGLRYAASIDLISGDTATRAVQAIMGLSLAAYANFMPKNLGALRSPRAAARTQAALRVGGWSFLLAGLAYAAIWMAAPLALADDLSIPVMLCAMLVTIGYSAWCFASRTTVEDGAG
jgi:hypothetical protein